MLFNGGLFSLIIGSFKGTIGPPINRIMHFYDPQKNTMGMAKPLGIWQDHFGQIWNLGDAQGAEL